LRHCRKIQPIQFIVDASCNLLFITECPDQASATSKLIEKQPIALNPSSEVQRSNLENDRSCVEAQCFSSEGDRRGDPGNDYQHWEG